MALYYIKSLEDLAQLWEQSDIQEASTVSSPDAVFADNVSLIAKLEVSQGEMEMYLADRFDIPTLRSLNISYLRIALAIIVMWQLEILGEEPREIIKQKYDYTVKNLKSLMAIVTDEGSVIKSDPIVTSIARDRRGVIGGRRYASGSFLY